MRHSGNGVHNKNVRCKAANGFRASHSLMIRRKDYGRKKLTPRRVRKVSNSLIQTELAVDAVESISEILSGELLKAWKLSSKASAGVSADALVDVFERAFGSNDVVFGNQVSGVMKRVEEFFALQAVHTVGGEPVRILAFIDKDPTELKELKFNKEVAETRTEELRTKVLNAQDMLTASDVAAMLSVTPQHVYSMFRNNKLLGLLQPGRERGVKFPRWQFDPQLLSAGLRDVLDVLSDCSAWDKWLFFTAAEESLLGLTPLEVLRGMAAGRVDQRGEELLASSAKERQQRVLNAAHLFAGD